MIVSGSVRPCRLCAREPPGRARDDRRQGDRPLRHRRRMAAASMVPGGQDDPVLRAEVFSTYVETILEAYADREAGALGLDRPCAELFE